MIFKKILIISLLCAAAGLDAVHGTFHGTAVQANTLPREIVHAFINADAKGVSKYFNSSIELILSESSGVHSKAQAEQILRTFFNDNASASGKFDYKHLHGSDRDNAQWTIGTLHTGKGAYRVTIFMKNQLIHRMRIESND